MNNEVTYIPVEELEPDMLVDLYEAAKASKRPKFNEETLLNFDAEWVEVVATEVSGNKTIVSVDRDYLPDVPVAKETLIPVLIEDS